MVILQDSREQQALDFLHEYVTGVEVMKLDVGDYGCRYKNGYVPPVYFERKAIGDLFSTLGGGYERFKAEVERAEEMGVKLVLIIEGTVTDVLFGYEHSSISGTTILRKLFTLWIKYDLAFICCSNRTEMSLYIAEYYASIGRKAISDLRELRKEKRKLKAQSKPVDIIPDIPID